MRVLVTGATGFIGGNVARALVSHGYEVRVLLRPESRRDAIAGLKVELAFGDLTDRPSLDRAVAGCDALIHTAAVYALWTPDPAKVYAANVDGTRNILSAAHQAGLQRVVFTSSESTIGLPEGGGPGREALETSLEKLPGHYKKSKLLSERAALELCQEKGLPVVVVNPTTPVGIGDVKPTPTGHIVLDFLEGRMPAYVDTGLNLVDVEDVAEGHVLALEKGRPGERYILGNRNMTLHDILSILAEITGQRAPGLRLPLWLALGLAYMDEAGSRWITRRPPRVPIAGVQAAHKFRYMDCTKAITELGLPQHPIEAALAKEVSWFRLHGYAGKKRGG